MSDESNEFWKSKPGWAWNLSVFLITMASAPLWAWVMTKNWSWFAVPLGAPQIGMAHAYGIWILLGMFSGPPLVNKNDGHTERDRDLWRVCKAWLIPPISLALGTVVHTLMT